MNYLETIESIESKSQLYFHLHGETKHIKSITELENLFIKYKGMRLTEMDLATFLIKINNSVVISISFNEFYPCCGKLLGKSLVAKNGYYNEKGGYTEIEENVTKKLFNILIELVEKFLISCKYSSFSLIVSKREQPVIAKILDDNGSYKIVNIFNNLRMKDKNVCLEYCKNFNY